MTDASPSEIMRRLDEVVRQLSDLAGQMREDRNEAKKVYLPREFYNEARKNDRSEVAEVAKDLEDVKTEQRRNSDFKRQVALGFALASITMFVTLGVAVSNLLSR